jgi:hypothetical protein
MRKALLERLGGAIKKRNPVLADRLQPGLPEARIRRMLQRGSVDGTIEPVVCLFGWQNGSRLDPSLTLAQATPFPGSIYIFMDLELMIAHFRGFEEVVIYQSKLSEAAGRYFPIFWDGSAGYLAVDLKNPANRVMLLDPESTPLAREAYISFEDFIEDAIRANEENENLRCL